MRKYLLFFIPLSQSFAVNNPLALSKLCRNSVFHSPGISEESKPHFNQFIEKTNIDKKIFDYTGETIKDSDNFAGVNLKNFNFTNAHLINIDLKKSILTETIFNGTTLEKVDLSSTDLKGVQFINCIFINCDLRETDITTTTLKGCKFKKVRLDDAILCDDFIFDANLSDYNLVKLYAEFIQKGEVDKAQALNKIFGVRKLKLKNRDLKNLDLTGINLQRADLESAKLQGTRLSVSLLLPQYENHLELVKLYSQYIQKKDTVNAQTLNTIFGGLQLILSNQNLSNLDLTRINLKNADLRNADLTYTRLINAHLKYTYLNTEKLQGLKLSEDLTLHFNHINELFYEWIKKSPHQHFYQKLINANVPLFKDVPYEHLANVDWRGRDLKNANFEKISLKNLDFTNANLKRAALLSTNFTEAILVGTKLKKAYSDCHLNLTNANLIDADLNKASLPTNQLNGVQLSENIKIDYCSDLFKLWAKDKEHRHLYQKLASAQVHFLHDKSSQGLTEINEWGDLNFINVNIDEFEFEDIHFKNIIFKMNGFSEVLFINCTFNNVQFINNTFQNCKFINCNFDNCNFDNATLKKVAKNDDFIDCTFRNIKIDEAISDCKHRDVKIFHTNLVKSYPLSRSNKKLIYNAFLKELRLNLKEADLRNLNLKGICLAEANLEGADLSGSNLSSADLRGANLKQTNFTGCNFSNVLISDNFPPFSQGYTGDLFMQLLNMLKSVNIIPREDESDIEEPPLKKIKIEKNTE